MTEVIFVGTSDAFGAGGRRQAAIVARGSRGTALLDCGATTTSGLNELGIERDEIDTIVLSHFHADHFAGVPIFILAARYSDERTAPLRIAGPPEVEARVRTLAEAMGHPIERDLGFELDFIELAPGRSCEVGPARVQAFETHHQLEARPHGCLLDAGGARLAYTGDTGWFSALPERVNGSDLLISECTLHRHSLDFHLSYEELVAHRDEFDCGRIVLTHLGAEMTDRRGRCEIETADDGMAIKL